MIVLIQIVKHIANKIILNCNTNSSNPNPSRGFDPIEGSKIEAEDTTIQNKISLWKQLRKFNI